MHKFTRITFFLAAGFVIFAIFSRWFNGSVKIGGDWPFYYKETFLDFSSVPTLWTYGRGGGFGGVSPIMNLDAYERFLFHIFVQVFKLDFSAVFFYGWYGLFLFLSVLSSYIYSRLLNVGIVERVISVLVFVSNTYVLMLVGGGQMGVALAYASSPLMINYFIRLIRLLVDNSTNIIAIRLSMLLSVFSAAVVVFFDPRIAFVNCIALAIYLLIALSEILARGKMVRVFSALAGVFVLAFGLNGFWLIPENITKDTPLSSVASSASIGSVRFFSFADFSHSFSLLHPNWPENIFGKTYFLNPLFLLLPLLAYGCLFAVFKFLSGGKRAKSDMHHYKIIIYFVLLSLIGTFLSKGSSPPFGMVYEYLFFLIPGFVLFRDPTKFYLLTALSYSLLIPLGLTCISRTLENLELLRKMRRYVFSIIMTLFLFAWMQMIKPALTGNLGGTFSYHPIPSGFREFQSVLIKDAQFSRTLWIPRQSRFSYYDSNHPPVELSAISPATTSAELSAEINDPVFQKKLIVSGIGYLVVPADPLGELFREERKYSQDLRDGYVRVLDRVPWLTKIQNGDIEVYKTKSHNNLFALPDGTGINFLRKNDAEYEITVLSGAATKLLFAQSYNAGWVVRYNNQAIRSSRTSDGFIEFDIPFRDKTMKGTVVFEPDGYRVIGYIVSAISVLIVLCVVGIRFI